MRKNIIGVLMLSILMIISGCGIEKSTVIIDAINTQAETEKIVLNGFEVNYKNYLDFYGVDESERNNPSPSVNNYVIDTNKIYEFPFKRNINQDYSNDNVLGKLTIDFSKLNIIDRSEVKVDFRINGITLRGKYNLEDKKKGSIILESVYPLSISVSQTMTDPEVSIFKPDDNTTVAFLHNEYDDYDTLTFLIVDPNWEKEDKYRGSMIWDVTLIVDDFTDFKEEDIEQMTHAFKFSY